MTLQEAILSGKRFRRKGWVESGAVSPDYWTYAARGSFTLLTEDILADDWETKDDKICIAENDFRAAWTRAVKKSGGDDITYGGFQSFRDLVAKELGL